jgi:hypothetical protein
MSQTTSPINSGSSPSSDSTRTIQRIDQSTTESQAPLVPSVNNVNNVSPERSGNMRGADALLGAPRGDRDEQIQAMKDHYETILIQRDMEVRQLIQNEEEKMEEWRIAMRALKQDEFYEEVDLEPFKALMRVSRSKIVNKKARLREFRDEVDVAIRKLREGSSNVTTPCFSRAPSPPALNTAERSGAFQEIKAATDPIRVEVELTELPVLPLANPPVINSRPEDTPLLPSQDARNLPVRPAIQSSSVTPALSRNLEETNFNQGRELGDRQRLPRPHQRGTLLQG